MKKNTLLLLFLCFIVSLNAQVEHSSKAITMTISLENNLQLFSNSEENSLLNPFTNQSRFQNGSARNLVVAFGSKKIMENDNYQAWSIFGSGSSWDRNDVFDVQDTLANTIDQVRFLAGTVNSYSVGLRYTYGFALTHKENLNFLIGFRGELQDRYYSAPATQGIGFDTNVNKISLRIFAAPEVQYIVPGKPYIISLSMALPVSILGIESQNVKNPALTPRQQKSGGAFFELFGFRETVFDLSIGYFLK